MELGAISAQKRYCVEAIELLRVVTSFPRASEEPTWNSFNDFYRALADRTLYFAEERLFPHCKGAYESLSSHDRKFCVPKWIYSIQATCETLPEARICVTLQILLKRRGRVEFEAREVQHWILRNGTYALTFSPDDPKGARESTDGILNKN